jgi:hypothetical protein
MIKDLINYLKENRILKEELKTEDFSDYNEYYRYKTNARKDGKNTLYNVKNEDIKNVIKALYEEMFRIYKEKEWNYIKINTNGDNVWQLNASGYNHILFSCNIWGNEEGYSNIEFGSLNILIDNKYETFIFIGEIVNNEHNAEIFESYLVMEELIA